MGQHREQLAAATVKADQVYWFQPAGLDWSLDDVVAASSVPAQVVNDIDALVAEVSREARAGDHIVIMSNGAFGGIHQQLLTQLENNNN
jgi:UDP-N-acetylmuramate: L-alanyl-gamma-D-glutamyl-meso-diaminopimelate ligase